MKPFFPLRAVPAAAPAAAPRRAGAFSLVVTLIIVSMLAVVAIGFLASMSSERTTADAFGNKARAEQAAQAGADSAMAILREAFKDFPDSATVWENHTYNKDGVAVVDAGHPVAQYNEGTSLYVKAMSNGGPTGPLPDPNADNSPSHVVSANDGSDARQLFVLPLISGAAYQPISRISDWTDPKALQSGNRAIDGKAQTFPDTYVDLNVRRAKDDSQGWLGSPPRPTFTQPLPPKTVRVPWVNIKQADAASTSSAPAVARYAFWVEDESFRANINYAGLGDAGTGTARKRLDNTGGPLAAAAIDPGIVDLFGPLRFVSNDSSASSLASSLSDTRKLYPGHLFSEGLGFAHTPGLAAQPADQLRYLTTTTSGGLNLSRHGTQRVNLNQLIYPKPEFDDPTPSYDAQRQIDAIVHTIQFHAPRFGQRFYRNVVDAKKPDAVSPSTLNALQVPDTEGLRHQSMYPYKIAANIKDYIDSDMVPTFLDGQDDGTAKVHSGFYFSKINPPAMVYPISLGNNIVWAQGKDSAPYLDECAVRFNGVVNDTTKRYELHINYYIEVWNPTTKDVLASELGTSPKVHIGNQPPWQAVNSSNAGGVRLEADSGGFSPSDEQERDCDIDIPPATVFKAGKATVLTTDRHFAPTNPDTSFMPGLATAEGSSNFVYCSTPPQLNSFGPLPAGKTRILLFGRQGSSKTSDYYTEVILYVSSGYIDTAPVPLPIYSGSSSSPIFIGTGSPATSNPNHTAYKAYGGSLRANGGTTSNSPEPSVTGDPRSNNEQLVTNPSYRSGTDVNQPRYYNFGANAYDADPPKPVVYPGTLGLPNTDYTKPEVNTGSFTQWPDYYAFPGAGANSSPVMSASNALMFVANSALTSIGQLGDIYDPARSIGTSLNSARGGGRTLKIGQHDDLWDGDYRSASRSWAAWRLADFFGINDAMLQPGLININGVARDNGAALRAALTGFKFLNNAPSGQGAPNIEKLSLPVEASNSTGATQGLDTLVSQMKRRLAPEASNYTTGTVGVAGDPSKPDLAPYNTGQGPFFERGEMSELPAFGRTNVVSTFPPASYTGADLVNGAVTNTTFDRGREEIFRRMAEIITTRGNVFTVYAMGQSLSPTKGVTSTQRLKVTFRLIPKQRNSTPGTSAVSAAKDFHPGTVTVASGEMYPAKFPSNPTSVEGDRFSRPDHYDIEILSASKGGG